MNSAQCRRVTILPVVKEELLSLQNGSFGKDPNAVVSIHHYHCNGTHQHQLTKDGFYPAKMLKIQKPTQSYLSRSSWD